MNDAEERLEPLEVVEDVPEVDMDSTFGLLPPWVYHDDDFPIAQALVSDMLGLPQDQGAGCLNRAAERRREHVSKVIISEGILFRDVFCQTALMLTTSSWLML